jgi:hypothetical protein
MGEQLRRCHVERRCNPAHGEERQVAFASFHQPEIGAVHANFERERLLRHSTFLALRSDCASKRRPHG